MEVGTIIAQPSSISLFAALLLLATLFIKRLLLSPNLNVLPEPRKYFLGSWLNLWELATHRDRVKVITKWCNDVQGSLMKVNAGLVTAIVLLSPENIQKIFGSADMKYLEKPERLYCIVKPVSWFNSVFLSKGKKWKIRRKLIVSKLSYHSLLNYIEPMNESSRDLVTKLGTMFDSGKDQDIHDILFRSTFRTLCKTVFGISSQEDYDRYACDSFIRITKRMASIIEKRVSQPWLAIDFLFRLHPSAKRMGSYYSQSRQSIEQVVQDYVEGRVETPSLIKDLLSAALPPHGIYEEVLTIFFAGHETTATALHYLFFLLALHPEHQEKCRQEVDSLFENSDICPNGNFSMECFKEMPYLEQCVMEALRMLPPVSGFSRKLPETEPVSLDDNTVLPGGSIISVFVPGIHMNPKYYPKPEEFEPTRFSLEERQRRSPYTYLPFSVGPRGCPGNKYAMNEMLIMAARVLRHFEITTSDKLEHLVFHMNITMAPETPMKFCLRRECHRHARGQSGIWIILI